MSLVQKKQFKGSLSLKTRCPQSLSEKSKDNKARRPKLFLNGPQSSCSKVKVTKAGKIKAIEKEINDLKQMTRQVSQKCLLISNSTAKLKRTIGSCHQNSDIGYYSKVAKKMTRLMRLNSDIDIEVKSLRTGMSRCLTETK